VGAPFSPAAAMPNNLQPRASVRGVGPRRSKAEWAEARAAALREQARTLRFEPSAGAAHRARHKPEQIAHLHAEAAKFDRIARALRKREPASQGAHDER
jgi:hypothetical protein